MSDSAEIHPTAVVSPGATIGEGVAIGPYCVVGEQVTIGDGNVLESHVVVDGATVLGPENVLSPMSRIGGPPQDLKYAGEPTRLEIGARNRIREFVTVNRGTEGGGGVTTVGDDNLLMAYTHIAHDCHVGSRNVFGNAATLAGHVEIGDDANVGAFSAIHQFCRVASHAFIGGGTIVTRDVLPWVLTVGQRPTGAHGLNTVGLKRRGVPKETVQALKACYTTLFRSKLVLKDAIEEAERQLGDVEEVRYFLEFVRSSQRGVHR